MFDSENSERMRKMNRILRNFPTKMTQNATNSAIYSSGKIVFSICDKIRF